MARVEVETGCLRHLFLMAMSLFELAKTGMLLPHGLLEKADEMSGIMLLVGLLHSEKAHSVRVL